jgi:hypothetical protein
MNTKYLKLAILMLAVSLSALGQDINPYAVFGTVVDTLIMPYGTSSVKQKTENLFFLHNADTTAEVQTLAFDFNNGTVQIYNAQNELLNELSFEKGEVAFISPDPHWYNYPAHSPYNYCGNNPIMRTDPTGMDWYNLDGETGKITLAQKTDDDFDLLMTMGANGRQNATPLQVNDKSLLPQLAGNNGTATTSNLSDAFNVFKFSADNSKVEWSLSGFKQNEKNMFYLNTENSPLESSTGIGTSFQTKDMLFNVHSHTGAGDNTKGGSGYIYNPYQKAYTEYYTGYDADLSNTLYNQTGKVMPLYVYYVPSNTLYQYTPNNPSINKGTIKSGQSLINIMYKK